VIVVGLTAGEPADGFSGVCEALGVVWIELDGFAGAGSGDRFIARITGEPTGDSRSVGIDRSLSSRLCERSSGRLSVMNLGRSSAVKRSLSGLKTRLFLALFGEMFPDLRTAGSSSISSR